MLDVNHKEIVVKWILSTIFRYPTTMACLSKFDLDDLK